MIDHGESRSAVDLLLIEDEALIRMMITDMVEELGHCVIAEAGNLRDAEPLARSAHFDLAILDINLGGDNIFPVAEIILARGLPFLFASGYGSTGLPDPFNRRQILRKPFTAVELGNAIEALTQS